MVPVPLQVPLRLPMGQTPQVGPAVVGVTPAQRRQQEARLERLESERRTLQQRREELLRQQRQIERRTQSQDNMQVSKRLEYFTCGIVFFPKKHSLLFYYYWYINILNPYFFRLR